MYNGLTREQLIKELDESYIQLKNDILKARNDIYQIKEFISVNENNLSGDDIVSE